MIDGASELDQRGVGVCQLLPCLLCHSAIQYLRRITAVAIILSSLLWETAVQAVTVIPYLHHCCVDNTGPDDTHLASGRRTSHGSRMIQSKQTLHSTPPRHTR